MGPRCPKYDTPRENHTRNTRVTFGQAVQQDAVDALSEVDALVMVKVYVPVKLRDIDATKANCGHIRDLVTVDEVVKAAAQSGADIGRQFSSRQHNVRQDAKGRFFLE